MKLENVVGNLYYTDRVGFMPAMSTFRWDILDRGVSGIVRPVNRAGLISGIYGPRVLFNGQAQLESSVPVTRTIDDP